MNIKTISKSLNLLGYVGFILMLTSFNVVGQQRPDYCTRICTEKKCRGDCCPKYCQRTREPNCLQSCLTNCLNHSNFCKPDQDCLNKCQQNQACFNKCDQTQPCQKCSSCLSDCENAIERCLDKCNGNPDPNCRPKCFDPADSCINACPCQACNVCRANCPPRGGSSLAPQARPKLAPQRGGFIKN